MHTITSSVIGGAAPAAIEIQAQPCGQLDEATIWYTITDIKWLPSGGSRLEKHLQALSYPMVSQPQSWW